MPDFLEHKVWRKPVEGLLVTAGLTLLAANLFNLESISMMGSAGFLVVFAAVNIANVAQYKHTRSVRAISVAGAAACIGALAALTWQSAEDNPASLGVLGVLLMLSFGVEAVYRWKTGRKIKPGGLTS